MSSRRGFLGLLASAPFWAGAARAEDTFIYRVRGTISAGNFGGLAAFMMNSVDQFVGLRLAAPVGKNGELFAEESDGVLSIWRRGGDVNLAFSSGFRKVAKAYSLDGFYRVSYGGMHQGINGLGLAPATLADIEKTGKPVKELDIGRLRPGL